MEKITMSRKQLKRHTIVTQVIDGLVSRDRAAEILGISTRQIDRIKKGYKEEGVESLIHKNTGRKPAHSISKEMKDKIIEIRNTQPYSDSNFMHFQELLEKYYGIKISYCALHKILTETSIKSPMRKRKRNKHPRRQRKQYRGELLQIDATPYEWFGGDKKYALHASIDDAGNTITGAYFTHNECLLGYLEVMRQTCLNYGIPQSVYSDKHTIFRSPKTDKLTLAEEIQGKTVKLTQFGRALDELGVNLIYAHSPQAKGRIERLWVTLQSRLPIELALRNITTIEQANEFLPEYLEILNKSFSLNNEAPSLYVNFTNEYNIDHYLCIKHTRKMDNAGTFSINRKSFKVIDDGFPLIPKKASVKVLISTRMAICVDYNGIVYNTIQYIKPDNPRKIPSAKSVSVKHSKPHLLHGSDDWKAVWHYENYNETLEFLYNLFLKKQA